MTIKKPSLAEDAILDAVQFPCWVQPKIDGVRAMNLDGVCTGRSLDPFKGYLVSEFFGRPGFMGLDGEMILGNKPNCTERLCSATTGAIGRIYEEDNKKKLITEMADFHWFVFDYLTPNTIDLPYSERYALLHERVLQLDHPRIHLVLSQEIQNRTSLNLWIATNANDGFEGTIIRNPRAPFKPGRATQKGQELWRVKPWADAEILVTGITEGNKNGNEAKRNTLGRTERSSAQAGLIPNGQVGSIQGTMVADFVDPLTGKLLFAKGLEVTIGSGEMTVAEATAFFQNPQRLIGQFAKFKHMTHGVKDQPRFPTFMSLRSAQDMS